MALGDLIKSRGTKIGGSIVGSAGILMLTLNLMNDKIDNIDTDITTKEKRIMEVIDNKHDQVLSEIRHLNESQREIKSLLLKLDQRVYELNKKQLYSGQGFEYDNETNNN